MNTPFQLPQLRCRGRLSRLLRLLIARNSHAFQYYSCEVSLNEGGISLSIPLYLIVTVLVWSLQVNLFTLTWITVIFVKLVSCPECLFRRFEPLLSWVRSRTSFFTRRSQASKTFGNGETRVGEVRVTWGLSVVNQRISLRRGTRLLLGETNTVSVGLHGPLRVRILNLLLATHIPVVAMSREWGLTLLRLHIGCNRDLQRTFQFGWVREKDPKRTVERVQSEGR